MDVDSGGGSGVSSGHFACFVTIMIKVQRAVILRFGFPMILLFAVTTMYMFHHVYLSPELTTMKVINSSTTVFQFQQEGITISTAGNAMTFKNHKTATSTSSKLQSLQKNDKPEKQMQHDHHHPRPYRIVWGIMSHNLNSEEMERRKMIRNTYLNFYQQQQQKRQEQGKRYVCPSIASYANNNDNNNIHNNTTVEIENRNKNEQVNDDCIYWICKWNDIIHNRLVHPDKCRLAYTFIIGGGNPNGPTQLLQFNDSYPLTLDKPFLVSGQNLSSSSNHINHDHPDNTIHEKEIDDDIVYLNIQENGDYGKTPTWFLYVTTTLLQQLHNNNNKKKNVDDDHDTLLQNKKDIEFDFIFKTDTDNVLFPNRLFQFFETTVRQQIFDVSSSKKKNANNNQNLNLNQNKDLRHQQEEQQQVVAEQFSIPTLVYGGRPLDKRKCGWPKHDHCNYLIGPIFNGGGCYFVSTELAEYISNTFVSTSTDDHVGDGGAETTMTTTTTKKKTSTALNVRQMPHEDMLTSNFIFSYPHPEQIITIAEPSKSSSLSYRKHPVKGIHEYQRIWDKYVREEQKKQKEKDSPAFKG